MSDTVLIVEDDPLLRVSACDLLEMSGATATAVGTADQALAYLEGAAATIGAMVTDVMMPGEMDGVRLAREVRRRWPHIRVLVTSGANATGRDDFPAGVAFVPKPWSARDILGVAP